MHPKEVDTMCLAGLLAIWPPLHPAGYLRPWWWTGLRNRLFFFRDCDRSDADSNLKISTPTPIPLRLWSNERHPTITEQYHAILSPFANILKAGTAIESEYLIRGKGCPTRMRFSCGALRSITMSQDAISATWYSVTYFVSYNNNSTKSCYKEADIPTELAYATLFCGFR